MCIEAWLDGCVERLLGIFVVKVPIFSCAMVAEGILSPFSVGCSLFILSNVSLSFVRCFSFLSIGYFSFLVVEGCVCFLFTTHFYPVRTSWCEHHIGLSAAYLFLTSDLHFLHAQSVILLLRSGFICCVRKVKRKNPVPFTPNPVNHNYLLHPCEGWRRKTKNSWRAYARAKVSRGLFFMGKQMVLSPTKRGNGTRQ